MNDFSQFYGAEIAKRHLRAAVALGVAKAEGRVTPVQLASKLAVHAASAALKVQGNGKLRPYDWVEFAAAVIHRFRDGEFQTEDDLLRAIGDRNLHAQTPSKRT